MSLVLRADVDLLGTLQSVEKYKALIAEFTAFSAKESKELAKLRKEPPTAANKERIALLEFGLAQRFRTVIPELHRAQQIYLTRLQLTHGGEVVNAAWAWLKKAKAKGP